MFNISYLDILFLFTGDNIWLILSPMELEPIATRYRQEEDAIREQHILPLDGHTDPDYDQLISGNGGRNTWRWIYRGDQRIR
jgi:hypothetical protein